MADITEILMSILCQQNTLTQCQQFVQEYATVWEQTIYFFFFPTVFVILFIHVLSKKLASNIGEKFRILIGVAIFVFIVMQGWYYYLLLLSKFWYISVIVLGGLWAFLNIGLRKTGGGGSSASHGSVFQKAIGSASGYFSKRVGVAIRGDEESMNKKIKMEEDRIEVLEKRVQEAEKQGDNYSASNLRHMKEMKMQEIEAYVGQLKEMTSYEGTKIGASKQYKHHKNWLANHSKK